jgi:hypothetical protein
LNGEDDARCNQDAGVVASAGNLGGSSLGTLAGKLQLLIFLPSFTALVKRDGPAVVNIGTAKNIRIESCPFPDFPGMQPEDPFLEFLRRFHPASTCSENIKPSLLVRHSVLLMRFLKAW